jgi:putative addiction module CopG family antidote
VDRVAGAGAKRIDKGRLRGKLMEMKVSLPSALEDFVSNQVRSGEFDDTSEVVGEALRLLRATQESNAIEEMRTAFAGVDVSGGKGEPTMRDRAFIGKLIQTHRSGKPRA